MTGQQSKRRALLAPIAVAVAFAAAPVQAALMTFTAFDSGAGSLAAAPNSVAEAASFDSAAAAVGTENLITFEPPVPLGAFTSLTPAPGVTVTGMGIDGNPQKIVNATACTPALCGYNTTPGGAQFLQLSGGFATFSFSPGISAYGSYLTGVQLAGETITFSDGSSQSIAIPNPGNTGGTDFVGFTDMGKTVLSLTINVQPSITTGDVIGVDDVRYVQTVPAPLIGRSFRTLLAVCVVLLGAKLFGRGQNRHRLGREAGLTVHSF